MNDQPIRIAILTLSDRAAAGEYDDRSGPALRTLVEEALGAEVVAYRLLPDDREAIADQLRAWADDGQVDLVLTTGGTGFGPRDITPEATRDVIEREAPGLAEAMRAASLRITPHAMLSRAVSGIRGATLIVNLPGSLKGATENLQAILPALPHAVELLRGKPQGPDGHA
jgi:molybdenum cofactor synthesis domain-containing protein